MLFGWITNIFGSKSNKAPRGSGQRSPSSSGTPTRRNSSRPTSSRKRTRQRANSNNQTYPYRAVAVYSQTDQCEAAKRLRRTKFLAAHAPTLPLGGCTQSEACRCRYRHFKDRRQEMRRDSDHGMPPRVWVDTERRHRKDRRKNDTPDSSASYRRGAVA